MPILLNKKKSLKKIAVLRALKLGDLICSVPAFRALKNTLPDTTVYLIGLPWAGEFAYRFNKHIDRFIEFPGFPGLPEQSFQIQNVIKFLKEINNMNFDLVIQMQGDGQISNLILPLLGAASYAGYYQKGYYCPEPQNFFPYPDSENEVVKHIELMQFLGASSVSSELEFPLYQQDYLDLKKITDINQVPPKQYVCLHPGAISSKPWKAEYFSQVGNIISSFGYKIILTGTDKEVTISKEVSSGMSVKPIDLTGKTTLGALAQLISNAKLLVTNDTGVSHLSAAVKTPSVVIFTSSDPHRWAPLDRELHHIVPPSLAADPKKSLERIRQICQNQRVIN